MFRGPILSQNRLTFVWIFLLIAAARLGTAQQCDIRGKVVPAGVSGCGVWITVGDSIMLQPRNKLDKLRPGQVIRFSYDLAGNINACPGAVAVQLSCLDILAEPISDCKAKFDHYPGTGWGAFPGVRFYNNSLGSYTDVEWDFGDGQLSNQKDSLVQHIYPKVGIYKVCLSITDGADCHSEVCSYVMAGNPDSICTLSDCVYPGDANRDGKANLYDLLMLGLGNDLTGPERPNASVSWQPQAAPDWSEHTAKGLNYKHFDCDGNGRIEDVDEAAISFNYQPCDEPKLPFESQSPLVWLVFDYDSLVVDKSVSTQVSFSARLMAGTSLKPANLYGLALYLEHPDGHIADILVNYNEQSFLGPEDNVLWDYRDLGNINQADVAFVRTGKEKQPAKGYGEIAKVHYIVEADIINGIVKPFNVNIGGGMYLDVDGTLHRVRVKEQPATIYLVDKSLATSTIDPDWQKNVQVFPNPATDRLHIVLGDNAGEKAELLNALGQVVVSTPINTAHTEISLGNLAKGIYQCRILTAKGMTCKPVVVR